MMTTIVFLEVKAVPTDWMPDKLFKQIDLELRAHEPAVLKSYSWFAGASGALRVLPKS